MGVIRKIRELICGTDDVFYPYKDMESELPSKDVKTGRSGYKKGDLVFLSRVCNAKFSHEDGRALIDFSVRKEDITDWAKEATERGPIVLAGYYNKDCTAFCDGLTGKVYHSSIFSAKGMVAPYVLVDGYVCCPISVSRISQGSFKIDENSDNVYFNLNPQYVSVKLEKEPLKLATNAKEQYSISEDFGSNADLKNYLAGKAGYEISFESIGGMIDAINEGIKNSMLTNAHMEKTDYPEIDREF